MWYNTYKDFSPDESLIKHPIYSGRGIVGCEMHDLNGWGAKYSVKKNASKKSSLLKRLINRCK